MSKINLERAIQNIGGRTEPYAALIELIVNAVEAIEEAARVDGCVKVRVLRSNQTGVSQSLPEVEGFEVKDNGIGFTERHVESFDTLYTDQKIDRGGKGFGRIVCLKHFKRLSVQSVFKREDKLESVNFSIGRNNNIVSGLSYDEAKSNDTGSIVKIRYLRNSVFPDKKLETIGKVLVQRILPFFISEEFKCPRIILFEDRSQGGNGDESICLNDFFENELGEFIKELQVTPSSFSLPKEDDKEVFSVRIFKLYRPRFLSNQISLVAHKREVSKIQLSDHIPEFEEVFYDESNHRFIIRAYVFGTYLDANVSVERGGFKFRKSPEVSYPIGQSMIETETAGIAASAVESTMKTRQAKKEERVQSYVDNEAPWYKENLAKVDISGLSHKSTDEQIEAVLHADEYRRESNTKSKLATFLSSESPDQSDLNLPDLVDDLSGSSKAKLAEYVVFRKCVLDLLNKSLEQCENGKYSFESTLHDIILRRRENTDTIPFEHHNLWLLEERLNYTNYVASDQPLGNGNPERPDILVFDNPLMFREDNVVSYPITIFEFKRPQYDDFVNPSSKEDPVKKIVSYVNKIREGEYKTPKGRSIEVTLNTPAYGFVVCDISDKVEKWLRNEKNFKEMPDKLGWFTWYDNINLFIQVIKWDKIFKDAEIRHRIFFKKLGIEKLYKRKIHEESS